MEKQGTKISACIITFNHEKYISQAIEGALSQKLGYSYEIVVGEDCSTDRTREIIKGYQKIYPDKIKIILNEKNLGMMGNWINTINACQGEYIAILEGDDYWTDEHKLQKQIDFLENNPNYSFSTHQVWMLNEDTNKLSLEWKREWEKNKNGVIIEDIIRYGGGATCSIVYRKDLLRGFPEWYKKQRGGDWSLQMLCASKGKMKYFPEPMGVYRVHGGGTFSAAIKEARGKNIDLPTYLYNNMQNLLDAVDGHFSYKYSRILDSARNYNNLNAFSAYALSGDLVNAKKFALKLMPILFSFPLIIILRIVFKIFLIYLLPKKLSMAVLDYFKQ